MITHQWIFSEDRAVQRSSLVFTQNRVYGVQELRMLAPLQLCLEDV